MREGQRNYTARAVSFEMGIAKTGTEQIGVEFLIVGGDDDGKRVVDFFPLSEKAIQYTFEKLLAAGWDGQDMVGWNGLGHCDCRLVVEDQEYEGELRTKVIFVNRVGVAMKNAMDAGQKQDFASRMRGHLAAFQQEKNIQPGQAPRTSRPQGVSQPARSNYAGGARGGFNGSRSSGPDAGAGADVPYED